MRQHPSQLQQQDKLCTNPWVGPGGLSVQPRHVCPIVRTPVCMADSSLAASLHCTAMQTTASSSYMPGCITAQHTLHPLLQPFGHSFRLMLALYTCSIYTTECNVRSGELLQDGGGVGGPQGGAGG